MQGVVRTFDPQTAEGVVVSDRPDRREYVLATDALAGSIFRVLRQGQRVVFELNGREQAVNVRTGAEADMGIADARV
jgi:cold shock CspA family protein